MNEVKYRSTQANFTLKERSFYFLFYIYTMSLQVKKQTKKCVGFTLDDWLIECELKSNKISKIEVYVQLHRSYSK